MIISFLKNVKRYQLFYPSFVAVFFVIILVSNPSFFTKADFLIASLIKQQYDNGHDYSIGVMKFINDTY